MAHTPDHDQRPYHVPVMTDQVLEWLVPLERGVIVDATFGGGGHTTALLEAAPQLAVLAIDQDPDAMRQVPDEQRLRFVAANFGDLARVLDDPEMVEWIDDHDNGQNGSRVAGVLFDLGVSSHQLEEASRGFSYRHRGPLDMRMQRTGGLTAGDLVNTWEVERLADVIRRFGEERYARRIAERIVAARPVEDTLALAEIVAAAVPAAARRQRHPARKTFQALRIAVNDELGALERALDAAIGRVQAGGRIVVISYHSLEDRIVKRRFRRGAGGCVCPPELPVCVCDEVSELRLLTRKPQRPTDEEIAANPRARSARLRSVEKVAA